MTPQQSKAIVEALNVERAEFDQRVNDHCAWVTACLADGRETNWMPSLHVLVQDTAGERSSIVHALAVPFNEHREKYMTMRNLGTRLYRVDKRIPLMACMSSEAWTSTTPGIEPRHDPARGESMIVQATTINGNPCVMKQARITRNSDECMSIGEWSAAIELKSAYLLAELFKGFFQDVARARGVEF